MFIECNFSVWRKKQRKNHILKDIICVKEKKKRNREADTPIQCNPSGRREKRQRVKTLDHEMTLQRVKRKKKLDHEKKHEIRLVYIGKEKKDREKNNHPYTILVLLSQSGSVGRARGASSRQSGLGQGTRQAFMRSRSRVWRRGEVGREGRKGCTPGVVNRQHAQEQVVTSRTCRVVITWPYLFDLSFLPRGQRVR